MELLAAALTGAGTVASDYNHETDEMYVGGHASANSVFAIVIDPSKMPGTQGLGGFTDVSGSLSLSLSLCTAGSINGFWTGRCDLVGC